MAKKKRKYVKSGKYSNKKTGKTPKQSIAEAFKEISETVVKIREEVNSIKQIIGEW